MKQKMLEMVQVTVLFHTDELFLFGLSKRKRAPKLLLVCQNLVTLTGGDQNFDEISFAVYWDTLYLVVVVEVLKVVFIATIRLEGRVLVVIPYPGRDGQIKPGGAG